MSDIQYLSENILLENISNENIQVQDLISSDTYNESKLVERISKMTDDSKVLLQKAAIHISIIGAGNKSFGSIRHKDHIFELSTIFQKLNVKYQNVQNSNLQDDDLTPRRLVRLYRYHIKEFIQRTGRPSYLFLKYSARDAKYMNICFPGAEHFVENQNELKYLIETYKVLDNRMNTSFCTRLERVFIARGITKPGQLEIL